VVVFTCLQAPTLPFVARLLRVSDDDGPTDVEVEAAPLDKISADLLQVRIPGRSRLAGVEISELRLDKLTVVSLIIRDGAPFVPSPRDRIKIGDELLIVTPSTQRLQTEERLRTLGRGGRLARWRNTLQS
jgi:cell volume regulation protein A